MNTFMVKVLLGCAGIPAAEVDKLEADAPAFARLCRAAQKIKPILEQAEPLLTRVGPQLEAMLPDLTKLMGLFKDFAAIAEPEKADAETVVAVLNDFVKYMNAGGGTAAEPDEPVAPSGS